MVHSIENGGMRQNMIDLKQAAPRSEVDRMECDHEAQGQRTCTAGEGSGAEKILGGVSIAISLQLSCAITR